jgi:hypothetical protein
MGGDNNNYVYPETPVNCSRGAQMLLAYPAFFVPRPWRHYRNDSLDLVVTKSFATSLHPHVTK